MPQLVLSKVQKQAVRQAQSAESACHIVYNATDDVFYFGDPDDIVGWIREVLCVETFFGAMCDGGVRTWFDWDHGRLAHLVPGALHTVGLPLFAACAERALAVHVSPPYPLSVRAWGETIERIRDAQLEDDFDESAYDLIEKEFFRLYHEDSTYFRTKLHAYVLSHLND